MKAYYIFLQWVLPKITDLNKYFQCKKAVILDLHDRMVWGFKDLLCAYVKREYVAKTKLGEIDPTEEENFVPIENLYLGVVVMKFLQRDDVKNHRRWILDFKTRCRDFLKTFCVQMQMKYDFEDPVLSSISILKPEKALSFAERNVTPSIIPLAMKVPRICSPDDDAKL